MQAHEVICKHVTLEDPHAAHTSLQSQLGASLVAGLTASVFSLPFDMLKSRLRKCKV